MTQAARELHIAQPALSVAIKKLETQLDVRLFRRDERTMALTQEGEVLLPYAKRVIQQLDDAHLAMQELKGLEKGEVKLGVPSMMGSYYFPEILMGFKSRYPKLKLTMVEAGAQSLRKMLLDGELDIAVILNEDIPLSLETDSILTSEMVAVTSPTHPLAQKKHISYQEFFSQELVMFKAGYFHREFIDEVCVTQGYQPHFSFETNLVPMILKIVKQEFAITALLKLVTDNEADVVGISFEQPVYLDLALAWRKTGYLSIAERTFIEYVKTQTH
nr:LysR family transcriptional regulator [Vibrio tapetis]